MTGIVGNKWSFDNFAAMEAIPPPPADHLSRRIGRLYVDALFRNWSNRSQQAGCTSRSGRLFTLTRPQRLIASDESKVVDLNHETQP